MDCGIKTKEANLMTKKTKIILYGFILLETILYLDLMFFHLLMPTVVSEYCAIALCFITLLLLPIRQSDWLMVVIGLAFTLIADFFLVILGDYQIIAVIAFCGTQIAYAIRLRFSQKEAVRYMKETRVFLFLFWQLLAFLVFRTFSNVLVIITLAYVSFLLGNIIHAFRLGRKFRIFAIALVLFLLCDIFVGLNEGEDLLMISLDSLIGKLLDIPLNMAWLFYVPSQVLIVLSVYVPRMNRKTVNEQM